MLNLIAAALVAAAPAPPVASAQPADAHAQHQKMDHQSGDKKPGMMAEMKDCCCKDMMAKMHKGHGEDHSGHKDR